jgi:hypothetical protein
LAAPAAVASSHAFVTALVFPAPAFGVVVTEPGSNLVARPVPEAAFVAAAMLAAVFPAPPAVALVRPS